MVIAVPVGGQDFPWSPVEISAWFSERDDCLDYLERLRWPGGIRCGRSARHNVSE